MKLKILILLATLLGMAACGGEGTPLSTTAATVHQPVVTQTEMALEPTGIEPILFYEGSVGIDVRLLEGQAVITRVETGSAADQAGVRPGCVIQSVDCDTIEEIVEERLTFLTPPFNEGRKRNQITGAFRESFYGPPDTYVSIGYVDENGQIREEKLLREAREAKFVFMPELPPAFVEFEARMLKEGIGYIRFNAFLPPVDQRFREALEVMANAPGLIIDIRGIRAAFFR